MEDNCIICNSNDWHFYCDIENSKYKVIICKNCSLTKLSPLPTIEELNKFYANQYRKKYFNQETVSIDVVDYEQIRANRVIDVIDKYFDKNYKNILDIGCSSGTLLKNIAKLSDKAILHGLEMNDSYRDYIIKNNIVDKNLISNEDINYYHKGRESKFDFISIVHVLEHLHDPKKTLESIYNLLSSNGRLYIEVPNLKTPYYNLKKRYFIIYHLYYFTDYTLRKLLLKTGFKILEEKQIATTSICFVCEKNNNIIQDNLYNKEEYYKVLKILKKYQILYPITAFKMLLIKILDLMGMKNFIKQLIGR